MTNPLALSDDDFLNQTVPAVVEEPEVEVVQEPTVVDTPVEQPEVIEPIEEETPVDMDYQEFYSQVMAPFNANGKSVKLNNASEVIQMMQMGANYTRKMQDIAPHRKLIMMLENNGLLDEDKLSYLIDLDKKNPEAITKLIKEAGIEPLDIDVSEEPQYQEGNHKISDAHINFNTVLDDLKSTSEGIDTIREINSWDQASKDILWNAPEVMSSIHTQKTNGIYGQIVQEIERRKLLGSISPTVPFLHVYKAVGEEMQATGKLRVVQGPVGTSVSSPRGYANGAQASATTPSRSIPKKVTTSINPLAMSDEDFLKQMANRV